MIKIDTMDLEMFFSVFGLMIAFIIIVISLTINYFKKDKE